MVDSKLLVKLKKEFSDISEKKSIYAIIAQSVDFRELVDAASVLLTKNLKLNGIYASLNLNHQVLTKRLKEAGADMDRIVIIDATGDKTSDSNRAIKVDNPKSLTALSLAIGETAQAKEFDFLLIDSLSTLLTYNSVEATEKFVHFMLSKMRNMHLGSIIIALEDSGSSKLIPTISQLCDKVIKI